MWRPLTLLLAALALPLSGNQPRAEEPCDALAGRVEREAIGRKLTATFCRAAVANGWLAPGTLDRLGSAADLRRALTRDPLETGNDLFAAPERQANQLPPATLWVAYPSEHYVFLARPGSAAAGDFEMIAREAERTRAALLKAFALEPSVVPREAALNRSLPPGVDLPVTAPRIVVYLYQNRDDAGKRIGGRSMGASSFGATIVDGRGALQLSSHVLYFNPLSIMVVQHEVAHLAAMLAAFDTTVLDQPLAGEADLRKAFFAGYRSLPAFLNEGLGDYGLYYGGIYADWALVGSPEALARGVKLPPLEKLIEADAMFHAREHKAFSLGAATFLRYLLAAQGAAPIGRWLRGGSFQDATGLRIQDAEAAWLKWLADRP